MPNDSIADASKPSAGRMYDYYLGGNHNFEVDRQAAEQVLKVLPFVAKFARLQRWALQDIAVELSEKRGYDVIIDFASGLPTMDHIHHKVRKGTVVIYSDYDPVVVEYAREIVKDTSNVYFLQADARRPEEMLNRPEVEKILSGRRRVAFVFWGVSALIPNEDIVHAVHSLYDWAAPGSCLVFNAQGADIPDSPSGAQAIKIYEQMGTPTYKRTLKDYQELLPPWKLEKPGFISLFQWNGFEESDFAKEDVDSFGPFGGGHGAYLVK
ncbi:MAG TPA: SAM-dependent methyltransferase [Anaerolineales bacterium]|nr:SAM-dependent methyltransferase [Anaerolineales bacterium]